MKLSAKNHWHVRCSQAGFTIIELMIATMIFSVVLLLLVFAVMHITQSYYKGITQSKTQNAARNIKDAITGAIKFGGATPTLDATGKPFVSGTTNWFCVGTQIFAYKLGYQLAGTTALTRTGHALVQGQLPDSTCPSAGVSLDNAGLRIPSGSVTNQAELLSPHMRLSNLGLKASPLGNRSWEVDVQVTYGDDDLLCNPQKVAGSCASSNTMTRVSDYTIGAPNETVICKQQTGLQFCAYSRLSGVVQTRIVSS